MASSRSLAFSGRVDKVPWRARRSTILDRSSRSLRSSKSTILGADTTPSVSRWTLARLHHTRSHGRDPSDSRSAARAAVGRWYLTLAGSTATEPHALLPAGRVLDPESLGRVAGVLHGGLRRRCCCRSAGRGDPRPSAVRRSRCGSGSRSRCRGRVPCRSPSGSGAVGRRLGDRRARVGRGCLAITMPAPPADGSSVSDDHEDRPVRRLGRHRRRRAGGPARARRRTTGRPSWCCARPRDVVLERGGAIAPHVRADARARRLRGVRLEFVAHRRALRAIASRSAAGHAGQSLRCSCRPCIAAYSLGLPTITVEQLVLPSRRRRGRWLKRILSLPLARQVVVGEPSARDLQRFYGIPGRSMRVHPQRGPRHPIEPVELDRCWSGGRLRGTPGGPEAARCADRSDRRRARRAPGARRRRRPARRPRRRSPSARCRTIGRRSSVGFPTPVRGSRRSTCSCCRRATSRSR